MGRSKGNSGSWLVTYSDMVTLLMVFFIVLYTMTPGIELKQFNDFISYFQSSVGVVQNKSVIKLKNQETMEYRKKLSDQWAVVEDFIERQNLRDDVTLEETEDGMKVTLSDSLTFNSGSSELLPMAKEVLAQIAGVFTDDVAETEVQGHTDTDPIARNSYYRSNWHLGAARGVSVLKFIQERSDLPPERYKASSFGEYRPVADNSTAEGKRKNRRVEIYVRYAPLMNTVGEGNIELPVSDINVLPEPESGAEDTNL